ncbi:MAG: hypothetical protein RBU30_01585 [Polyangia bacterium]|jgi:hypothetical protein|nr:hypothetical protein [Polyangia bacterium]
MAVLDYLIPGYKGYRQRDESRETDKLFRDYLSKQLGEDSTKLESAKAELSHGGNLAALNPADQATKVMTKVRDRLRFANYGFHDGMFGSGAETQMVLQVEEFDKGLVDDRNAVRAQVQEIENVLMEGGNVAPEFQKLTRLLREFDEKLNRREAIIRGQA